MEVYRGNPVAFLYKLSKKIPSLELPRMQISTHN